MINTTDRPILLKDASALDKAVRAALSWAESVLRNQLDATGIRAHDKESFARYFGEANRRKGPFDERFVQAVFDLAGSDAQNRATQDPMAHLTKHLRQQTVSATHYPIVKRGLKLALVKLWRQRVLLLPTIFTPGPYFSFEVFDHELLRWLHSFDPKAVSGEQKVESRRLYYYGPRLLIATSWMTVEDVSVNEIAQLNLAQRLYERGDHPHAIAGSQFPWSQFPSGLLKTFPTRVSFGEADLIKYSAWAAQQAVKRGPLEEFVIEDKAASKPRQPQIRTHSPRIRTVPVAEAFAADVQQASTHDAVLALFKRLSVRPESAKWQEQVPVYPGREHIDTAPLCAAWVRSFQAFLHHREHIQGYRNATGVMASLNLLADYLFFYLPWWRELYPAGAVDLPAAPKDFARYVFISRHESEPLERLPTPLLQIVKLRRATSKESESICIKHLTLYFRFVAAHFADDETIAGPTFRNPLDDEFDAPRSSGKKNKTNKKIIPRNIYGHLLFWSYAVEAFGQKLLERALDGDFEKDWHAMRAALRYDGAALGIVPVFRFRGAEIPVRSIPNVFTWVEREVVRNGEKRVIAVPHATALRLLIVALETGLRGQSIQWLDRTTWDSLNEDAGERYTYRLFVNTDKTKVDPWAPPIVFRVRQLMQREVAFQKLFTDFDTFEPVLYEGAASSPFDPIRPLFRAPNNGRPVRDGVYSNTWVALLSDFEEFYKKATGERHVRLVYLKSQKTADGQPVVQFVGREANAYCPISWLAVHTPHSCRATFATNRQGQGILELSDVAELLGHEGVATTAHYSKFSDEQLSERLQRSDANLLGDYSIFEFGPQSGYVRADKSESALVRSFSQNREGTVATFKFMPAVALWSIEDDKLDEHDGFALLKSGPMSHIRFRETHICPVGEECPGDIVQRIGKPRLCGICPLAMRCIDHLPAISAKRNQLLERVRFLHGQRKHMEAAGEPTSSLDALWDEMQLTINELLGWQFSEEILHGMLVRAKAEGNKDTYMHVERPDIVRRHLARVTHKSDRTEFLLKRLAESSAYPSMSSPEVQLAAAVLRRRLSAGEGPDALFAISDGTDDVRSVAAQLGTLMKASGMNMKEVSRLVNSSAAPRKPEQLLLPSEVRDGE